MKFITSFDSLKLSTKMFIGSCSPLFLVIVLGLFSYNALQKMKTNGGEVEHTYNVLLSAAAIEKSVVDLETGERGFIITGKERFLEPFNKSKQDIFLKISELRKTVSDNPEQTDRLSKIEKLVNNWINLVAMIAIDKRREIHQDAKNSGYLQDVLLLGVGKGIIDQIREDIDKLKAALKLSSNEQALIYLLEIDNSIIDQEAGQRGFLITGKDAFLDPFYRGQETLKENLSYLHEIIDTTYDKPDMKRAVKDIEVFAEDWDLTIAQPQIALRRELLETNARTTSEMFASWANEGRDFFDNSSDTLLDLESRFVYASSEDGAKLALSLTSNLSNQETGLRGFLMTGDLEFLEPYHKGKIEFRKNIQEMYALIENNFDSHKARRLLSNISELSQEWISKAATPEINARIELNSTNGSMDDIIELIEKETGKKITDEIRALLSDFKSAEETRMKTRMAAEETSFSQANWVVIMGTLCIILLSATFAALVIKLIDRTLRKTVDIADAVSEGDYDVEILQRGKDDYLGAALRKMTLALKTNSKTLTIEQRRLKELDWIKTTQARIIESIQGASDRSKLSTVVLSELVPALNAHLALFYMREDSNDEQAEQFSLIGTYAHTKRKHTKSRVIKGEGLVGQCIKEGKKIILTEAPEDYIEIASGSGKAIPNNIIVIPVVFDDKVSAVIEVASFECFNNKHNALIDQLAKSLGAIINGISSKEETDMLLSQSVKLTGELKEQQEELKASNEELEEKTSILVESEEELKTQSDQLKAANEELEEQSERLKLQNESIIQKNIEVEKARVEVEERAKDLASASKYKSEFLANMSHELRTPLNSLLILSKDMGKNKEGNLTAKQITSANIIHEGGQDLLTLINDILDLSKVESGKLKIVPAKVSISEFIETFSVQFEPIVKEKGLGFSISNDSGLDYLMTDELRMAQVIKNLCFNSVKFTEKGSVSLHVHKAENVKVYNKELNKGLAFSVVDTGIGISDDKRHEIFEAFQQGDGTSNRNYGGTGLGLAISRAMAELLGGELVLENKKAEGSTFTLVLPLEVTAEVIADSSAILPTLAPPSPTLSSNAYVKQVAKRGVERDESTIFLNDDRADMKVDSKSLLIIEDDAVFAQILIDTAKERGYLCLSAGDGASGIALAEQYRPSGIILDIGLPDVDGMEVLKQLKFNLATRHIPVHIVSGREEVQEYRDRGAIGYLMKGSESADLDGILEKIESINMAKVKNVLIVEDDNKCQVAITSLIDTEVVKIDISGSGYDAFEKLKKEKYDCIILDLTLPDMSGLELLKKLKLDKVDIPPVVVYTGQELEKEEHDELRLYSSAIVIKGSDSSERLVDEISLFLHSVESEMPESQKKAVQMLHNSSDMLDKKRILLVDDDVRNVFALSSTLEAYGLDVIVASNGKVAVNKLQNEEGIDLVIMDIMMPIMDGYEAMRVIRKEKKFSEIPIIALTAKAMTGDREKCIEAGANDYITKPVDVDKLISMMKVWLFN